MNASDLLRLLTPSRPRFVRQAARGVGADADDVVQKAFGLAVTHADAVVDPTRAEAWFRSILRRTILDHHRRRRRFETREVRPEDAIAPLEASPQSCECSVRLLATLTLPATAALQAVDLDGKTRDAVASELGITLGALDVRLHRARRALRSRVERYCGVTSARPCLDCTCDGEHRCGVSARSTPPSG